MSFAEIANAAHEVDAVGMASSAACSFSLVAGPHASVGRAPGAFRAPYTALPTAFFSTSLNKVVSSVIMLSPWLRVMISLRARAGSLGLGLVTLLPSRRTTSRCRCASARFGSSRAHPNCSAAASRSPFHLFSSASL